MLFHLKVVELATMVAAPAAGGLLADWGAQVIKIEPHGGDPMRGSPGSPLGSINFDLHNRNKRSIALDTRAPGTREVILRLVKEADVFLTNMLPEQVAKLDLGWETLHAVNPRLVYATVSSFGQTGPDRDRGATDNLGFWARAGGTGLLTVEGQDPLPVRQSVGDRITGALACAALMSAVSAAQATGQGRFVDTSLLSAGMWAFSTDIANHMNRGRTAPSRGRTGAVIPLANYFRTRDGRWLQVHTGLSLLAPVIGRPDLLEDPRFAAESRPTREDNAQLVALVDEAVAGFDFADLSARLEAAGVRWEPVSTPADLAQDPQVLATGRLVRIGEGEDTHWQVANPWSISDAEGASQALTGGPPGIGEHAEAVLSELGYGPDAIAKLRGDGTLPQT
jgi:crotonobetainyl-CoA:carnitine CoA-transferase CaiB-like acyl-CoA transferase